MSIYVFDEQEAELSTVADADEMIIHDNDAGITKKVGVDTLASYANNQVVTADAATLSVTAAAHAGRTILLARAAGVVATLPAATGTGNRYSFAVAVARTSNTYTIQVANATDVMSGSIIVCNQADGTTTPFGTVAASDSIVIDGDTKGGLIGGLVTIVDVAAGQFSVVGTVVGTGAEATPFAAAVS
jgi:hypothetical protein